MSRQERARREHAGSGDGWKRDPNTREATHENMEAYRQQIISEHTTEASENYQHWKSLDQIFIGKRSGTKPDDIRDWCCVAASNGYECNCES